MATYKGSKKYFFETPDANLWFKYQRWV